MINLMRNLYKNAWVPFFGRILSKFIPIIEGAKPKKEPTFKIKEDN
tara:strand:- start:55867 stop:56004 length:138 start_codon:yes stop_codon:yes gene_type:complete